MVMNGYSFFVCVLSKNAFILNDYKVLVVKKRNNADKIKLSSTKLASDREYQNESQILKNL